MLGGSNSITIKPKAHSTWLWKYTSHFHRIVWFQMFRQHSRATTMDHHWAFLRFASMLISGVNWYHMKKKRTIHFNVHLNCTTFRSSQFSFSSSRRTLHSDRERRSEMATIFLSNSSNRHQQRRLSRWEMRLWQRWRSYYLCRVSSFNMID